MLTLQALNQTIDQMIERGYKLPEATEDKRGNLSVKLTHVSAFNIGERTCSGVFVCFGCALVFESDDRNPMVLSRGDLESLLKSIHAVNTSERLKAEKLIQSNQPYIKTDNGAVQNPNSPLIEPKKLTRG